MRCGHTATGKSWLVAVLLCCALSTLVIAQDKPLGQQAGGRPSRPELQERFDAALKLYNEGQYEKAATALDEVLRMAPTPGEALELRKKAGVGTLLKMLKEPKLTPAASLILQKAAEETRQVSRDPATLKALLEKLGSEDAIVRWPAIQQLSAAGSFAVPYLLDPALSDEPPTAASPKIGAVGALRNIGRAATPALVVALQNADDASAARIAGFLAESADARAIPALAAIVENPDKPEFLRQTASKALRVILPLAAPSAAQAYFELSQRYYYADPTLIEIIPAQERVLWAWNPKGKLYAERLVFEQAPTQLYPRLMAQELLLCGMKQKHTGPELLELYISNNYMLLEQAGGLKEPTAQLQAVSAINESFGAEYLYLSLGRALRDGNTGVARRCIEALRDIGDSRPPKWNTLLPAMNYPDKLVRVNAAETLMYLSPMGALGGTSEVVNVLAAGLGARVRERVVVLTGDNAVWRRLSQMTAEAGMDAKAFKEPVEALRRVKEMVPPVNLLIADTRMDSGKASTLVDSVRNDSRSAAVPIILLAPAQELEKLRAGLATMVAAVLPLTVEPKEFRTALAGAMSSSSKSAGAEDVRENTELVRRILTTLAGLPPATKYPTRGLDEAAAGLLQRYPVEIRILALKAIANLPRPGLRDGIYNIFPNGQEPLEVRREAGEALLRLLVVEPDLAADQRSALRKMTGDADETLRLQAYHALAIAAMPQSEREANAHEIEVPPPAAAK